MTLQTDLQDAVARVESDSQILHNIIHGGLNLPTDLNGHAGQLLAINETEDGYEPIESKAVFYGLKKDGAKLIAVSGEGTFDASEFPVWMVGLPGMNYAVNENGHLLINI